VSSSRIPPLSGGIHLNSLSDFLGPPQSQTESGIDQVAFSLNLSLEEEPNGWVIKCSSELSAIVSGNERKVILVLPDVDDGEDTNDHLLELVESALGNLAAELMQDQTKE